MPNDETTITRDYSMADLQALMRRLRDPDTGCPWDLAQTWRSIAPSTLEEAYEVIDAIERGNFDHLEEELGDLLFQIVFYTQLASEERRFNFDSVVTGLVDKLVRRHPHVFPDGDLYGVGNDHLSAKERHEISTRWEQLKEQERAAKGYRGVLDDVPGNLPALTRAAKLQKRASAVGFDWPDISGVIDKVEEELAEVREAIESGEQRRMADELGDLLFAVVNACRHVQAEPEAALRNCNRKFESRFRFIESQLAERGLTPADASLEVMDELWEVAKKELG